MGTEEIMALVQALDQVAREVGMEMGVILETVMDSGMGTRVPMVVLVVSKEAYSFQNYRNVRKPTVSL